MSYAFSVLMFLFAAALLLYAALLALTKDDKLLPYQYTLSAEPKDSRAYVLQFSKVIALVALAIAAGAAAALWNQLVGAVVMIAAVIAAIWCGTKMMKKVSE